jgi:hypothetical protein
MSLFAPCPQVQSLFRGAPNAGAGSSDGAAPLLVEPIDNNSEADPLPSGSVTLTLHLQQERCKVGEERSY